MSERERLTHKERLKKLDIKKINEYEKLIGRVGLVGAGLILLAGVVFSIVRG